MSADGWITEPGAQDPVVIAEWDGEVIISLTSLSDGTARLKWVFKGEPLSAHMYARLTDAEAQQVFQTSAPEGLLERVRPTMAFPEVRLCRDGHPSIRFIIGAGSSEEQVWEAIWSVLRADPAHTSETL